MRRTASKPLATTPASSVSEKDLAAALSWAVSLLRDSGITTPLPDAELLAAHTLGESRGRVSALKIAGFQFNDAQADTFDDLVSERAQRIPLQHLTGKAPFRYLELEVGPGAFVPRPETESVAGLAIDYLKDAPAGSKVVDLGTGSGAIAASIAHEVPHADVTAVELSPHAFAWAERNLSPLGVRLLAGDFGTALEDEEASFAVVISNPPYIPTGAVPQDEEVRLHDPEMALYGGSEDGLKFPRIVMQRAAFLLEDDGFFVMEHAEVQAAAVAKILAGTGLWRDIQTHQDLTGRDRATSARRLSR